MRAWWMIWAELGAGTVSGLLFVITLTWPTWIESVFGVDPDGGNGLLEWAFCGVAAGMAASLLGGAFRQYRRLRAAGIAAVERGEVRS